MIGKNYKYNGMDFSPSKVFTTNTALTDVEHITDEKTDTIDNVNDHGSIASNTIESGRLIEFSGYIFGITKVLRGTYWRELNNKIYIEPYVNANPFKKLEFQTDEGVDRWVMAKVNKKPKGTNGMNDSRIEFSFSLFVNTNEIYGNTFHTINGVSGTYGGTSFPNSFGDGWGDVSDDYICANAGNFKAGCKIQSVGTLINPKIKNITNGQEFKILGTTTNLILDSLMGERNVTDEGIDIMYKRDSGVPIYLSPGNNIIIVTDDTGAVINYTVSWYDTWNTI